ncbi:ciliary microtubule inner protein 1 [Discoglossus pictus]
MAAPQQSANQGKYYSYVAQDRIWKAHVETEMETTKRWPKRWGFLATPYDQLVEDKHEKVELKIPEHLQVRALTPVEKYIKVDPSPEVPKTTQGLVGWRSTIPQLQLERYGTSRYFKGDFCKQMKWPVEGLE